MTLIIISSRLLNGFRVNISLFILGLPCISSVLGQGITNGLYNTCKCFGGSEVLFDLASLGGLSIIWDDDCFRFWSGARFGREELGKWTFRGLKEGDGYLL